MKQLDLPITEKSKFHLDITQFIISLVYYPEAYLEVVYRNRCVSCHAQVCARPEVNVRLLSTVDLYLIFRHRALSKLELTKLSRMSVIWLSWLKPLQPSMTT